MNRFPFPDLCTNRRLFAQRVCHKCWIKVTRAVEDDTRKKVSVITKNAALTAAAAAAAALIKASSAGSAAADKIRSRLNGGGRDGSITPPLSTSVPVPTAPGTRQPITNGIAHSELFTPPPVSRLVPRVPTQPVIGTPSSAHYMDSKYSEFVLELPTEPIASAALRKRTGKGSATPASSSAPSVSFVEPTAADVHSVAAVASPEPDDAAQPQSDDSAATTESDRPSNDAERAVDSAGGDDGGHAVPAYDPHSTDPAATANALLGAPAPSAARSSNCRRRCTDVMWAVGWRLPISVVFRLILISLFLAAVTVGLILITPQPTPNEQFAAIARAARESAVPIQTAFNRWSVYVLDVCRDQLLPRVRNLTALSGWSDGFGSAWSGITSWLGAVGQRMADAMPITCTIRT